MALRGSDAVPPEDVDLARRLTRVFWLGVGALLSVAFTAVAVHVWWARTQDHLYASRAALRVARDVGWAVASREAAIRDAIALGDTASLATVLNADDRLDVRLDSLVALQSDSGIAIEARAIHEAVSEWERLWANAMVDVAELGSRGPAPSAESRARFDSVTARLERFIVAGEERFRVQQAAGRRASLVGVGLILSQSTLLAVLLVRIRGRTLLQWSHIVSQRRTMAAQLEELSRARAETQSVTREHARSQATLDTVLAGAPVGIAVLDAYGRVERVNDVFAQFAGASPRAFTGRYLREAAPRPARVLDPLIAQVHASATPLQDVEIEGAAHDAGGKPRLWRVSVYPARGGAAQVEGVGIIAVDITSYRTMERQLMQSQKMEAVGRLAGSIAHDFNNMLTAISAFAQFAHDEVDPKSRAREDIGQIVLAAERGAALTRRLTAFSQPHVTSSIRVSDLPRLLRDLTGLLTRLVGEDVTLNTHIASDLWPVEADPSQIEQVVLNLVVNARDAMPSGGTIVIEAANTHLDASHVGGNPRAHPGPHVMLAVTDTGVGMDAETRARIFEPFFTTKPLGKGTGLGLATVRSIVDQLAGAIWVYSEPGRGSTFKVYLPRSARAAGMTTPPGGTPVGEGLAALSLLLVEDDPSVRRAVQRGLERYRCTVHVADNGRQALEVLEQLGDRVDVVLSDLVMPEMGGLEFSRAVRERAPHVRLILMSGYTVESVQHQALHDSGALFLEKPFTTDDLVVRIREAMEAARRAADDLIGD